MNVSNEDSDILDEFSASSDSDNVKLHSLMQQMQSFANSPSFSINSVRRGPGRPPKQTSGVSIPKELKTSGLGEILSSVLDNLVRLNDKIDNISTGFVNFEHKIRLQETQICSLKSELTEEKDKVKNLEERLENLEQMAISKKVVIAGPRVEVYASSSINPIASEVVTMVNETLGSDINENNIINITKYGKGKSSLLLNLKDENTKAKLFAKLKNANRQMYVNELLIPRRAKLYYEMRRFKSQMTLEKRNDIRIFVRSGIPMVKFVSENKVMNIKTDEDLKLFIDSQGVEARNLD